MSVCHKLNGRRPTIGYWISERKRQKLNWKEFGKICRDSGFDLIKIDLTRPLEEQGPFDVILHKLTEYIARKDQQAVELIRSIEKYLASHIEIVVIDPFDSVRTLLDRYRMYTIISQSGLDKIDIFAPHYVELSSGNTVDNIKRLQSSQVTYPFVCKPYVAQGTVDCHKMALIFNHQGVADCKPPCIAQSFVNHNAVLFKIFIVGDEYQVVERPSLKNFYVCDKETIFFDTHEVSKSESRSPLSILDPEDQPFTAPKLDAKKLDQIVKTLQKELNLALFGIDIVVENETGRHAIIDINVYPGYDGFPDFFNSLMRCIKRKLEERWRYLEKVAKENRRNLEILTESCSTSQDDSGFDTCDSSDERKHLEKRRQQISSSAPVSFSTNSVLNGIV